MKRRGLLRAGALTIAASVVTLAINLVTGVIVARRLDAFGRGEVTAILTLMQFSGLVFTVGARPAISFRIAKHPDESAVVLGSWLSILPLLWIGASVAAEVALPSLFAAQQAHELALARVFVLMAGLIPASEILTGALLGAERFSAWNAVKLAQPVVLVAGYVVLLVVHEFTVTSALIANTVAIAIVPGVAGVMVLRSGGLRRPQMRILRPTVSYGIRSHATAISSLVNFRLDLVVMPAILPAREIGLYAVAVSVSSVVVSTTGTLNYLIVPAAVRRGDQGPQTVLLATLGSIAVGTAIAAPIGLTAAFLIPAVYGPEFRASVTPLLLLLPGSVLVGPGSALSSGLESLGRPGLGSVPPLIGAVLTVIGLTQFLGSGGAAAAAIVSTVSYATVFGVGFVLFLRAADLDWWQVGVAAGVLAARLRAQARSSALAANHRLAVRRG